MGFHCQRNPGRHLTTQVIGITACLPEALSSTRTIYRNTAQNIFTNKMEGSGQLWQRIPNTSQSFPWSLALCCLLHPIDTETQWCKPTSVSVMGKPYQHSPFSSFSPFPHLLLTLSPLLFLPILPSFGVYTWKDTLKFPVPGIWEGRKKSWEWKNSLAFLTFRKPNRPGGQMSQWLVKVTGSVACCQVHSLCSDSAPMLQEKSHSVSFYQQEVWRDARDFLEMAKWFPLGCEGREREKSLIFISYVMI